MSYFLSKIFKNRSRIFCFSKDIGKKITAIFGMGDSKEKITPMEPQLKLMKAEGKRVKNVKNFHQLVGILIYLIITRHELLILLEFFLNSCNVQEAHTLM